LKDEKELGGKKGKISKETFPLGGTNNKWERKKISRASCETIEIKAAMDYIQLENID